MLSKLDFDVSSYPELPKFKGVFVTATDTEVGKTLISGAIARSIRKAGLTVEPFKPAASGCRHTPGGHISEDGEFLAAAADSNRLLEEITPVRLGPALAPNVAAARMGKAIDLDKVFAAYRRMEGTSDAVVVEGVGGLLCPLTDDFWVIHLAKLTGLPMVIIARPNLGTINHTLLTVYAAQAAGIEVAGIIINRYQVDPNLTEEQAASHGDAVLAMHTNPDQIAKHSGLPVLALVPDDPKSSVANGTIGPDTQFAVDTVDWKKLLKL